MAGGDQWRPARAQAPPADMAGSGVGVHARNKALTGLALGLVLPFATAVCHLVDGAVAPGGDDQLTAFGHGAVGQVRGVPGALRSQMECRQRAAHPAPRHGHARWLPVRLCAPMANTRTTTWTTPR